MRRIVFAALIAALPLGGCGPKAIIVGSRPFPSEKAVFADESGKVLTDLPGGGEAYRLVLIDFPWCTPCADAWKSVRAALETAPPGTVRTYRVLFDREISIAASGKTETAPMRPVPPPWPEVTTLTVLPGAFLEAYRVHQAPMLLLIDRDERSRGDGSAIPRTWKRSCPPRSGSQIPPSQAPPKGEPRPERFATTPRASMFVSMEEPP